MRFQFEASKIFDGATATLTFLKIYSIKQARHYSYTYVIIKNQKSKITKHQNLI